MVAAVDIFSSGQSHPAAELRIVLIGESNSKASSTTGNIILGENVFDTSRRTAQSEAKQQEVFGRLVTVVDTPGCWWHYPSEDTAELDRIEIRNSVHLCPPGPHVFLLVIPVDLYLPQRVKSSLEEHLQLFNEDVFSHTIVLFAADDPCSDEMIEYDIEDSPTLQWILQQCGNRKHVLNISDKEDKDQVKMLFEKIDTMVANNGGRHCPVDRRQGEALRKEITDLSERASRRFDQVQKQRRKLEELIEGERQPVTEIRIGLVGQKCSGKSKAGNIILHNEIFHKVFDTARLKKNYQDQRETSTCVKHEGDVDGVKVSVVETPGWFTDPTPPDWIKGEVLHSVSMCPPGPHVFLLVVPISRAFTEKDLKALVEVLMPLTERVWRHCMVLFTWGDWLNDFPVENYIAREGKELQELLEKCGNRYHVLNPYISDDPVQVKELFQKIIDMVTQNKECFTTEGTKLSFLEKFSFFFGNKKQMEEEWKKREEELIRRMLKALAKEPEEPTVFCEDGT